MQSCYPSQLRINDFYLWGTSRRKGQCRTACPRRHPWRKALLCLLSLVSVLLCDLRATSAPCPEASRAQSLHHPSDVFCHLVRLFGEVGRLSCSSSSPLFISARDRLGFGGEKSPEKLCLLGGKGTGFPPASLILTQLPFLSKDIRWEPQRAKHILLFSLLSLIWVIFSARYHTPSRRIVL